MLTAHSQTFKGGAFIGAAAAQMDGDDYYGFDKLGVTAGIIAGFDIADQVSLEFEFTYSQEGGTDGFLGGFDTIQRSTTLHYLRLPIIFKFKDWLIENAGDDYYRVFATAGFSPGVLFSSNIVPESSGVDIIDDFNQYNFSWLLGLGWQITPNISTEIRYVRSFNNLYFVDMPVQGDLEYLFTHYIDIRGSYYF